MNDFFKGFFIGIAIIVAISVVLERESRNKADKRINEISAEKEVYEDKYNELLEKDIEVVERIDTVFVEVDKVNRRLRKIPKDEDKIKDINNSIISSSEQQIDSTIRAHKHPVRN